MNRERLFVNESLVALGLEVGGEISRKASEDYSSALRVEEKKKALKEKATGLIIQNPQSGFGLKKRQYRFPAVTTENFWCQPRLSEEELLPNQVNLKFK